MSDFKAWRQKHRTGAGGEGEVGESGALAPPHQGPQGASEGAVYGDITLSVNYNN